jgi:hypothetical protein
MLAAMLGSLILMAAASLVIAHERLGRSIRERAMRTEALRTAVLLPRIEWRALSPHDIRAAAADSVRSRLIRGFARGCGVTAGAFEYTGIRDPDPQKDSAIVIAPSDAETIHAITHSTPAAACSPRRGRALAIAFGGTQLERGSVALIFESGTYYLSASALRYRRGSEGRQPLTQEYLDTRLSGFAPIPGSAGTPVEGTGIRVLLQAAGAVHSHGSRVSFLNATDASSLR